MNDGFTLKKGDHIAVRPQQITPEEKEKLLERLTDRVKDYIAGSNFEDDLHRLVCDELGIDQVYNPEDVDEENPNQMIIKTAYYNVYAKLQMQILASAAEGM